MLNFITYKITRKKKKKDDKEDEDFENDLNFKFS
jgi:hypothetical protein